MSRARVASLLVGLLVASTLWARSCRTDAPVQAEPPRAESVPDVPRASRVERRRVEPGPTSSDASAATDPEVGGGAAGDAPPADVPVDPVDPVELVVSVSDASGHAVPGLVVTARRPHLFDVSLLSGLAIDFEPSDDSAAPEPVSATADASGVARLAAERSESVRVAVDSGEWAGETDVRIGDAVGPIRVTLTVAPAFRLAGCVVHDDGTPVANATVYISVPLPGPLARMPRRLEVVRGDADGVFRCSAHPVPDTRIVSCYVMAPTVAGTEQRFPVTAGARGDVELVIPRGTVVRGRCVDEHGEPLAHVRLRGIMPGTGEITYTNDGGRFALPVPAKGGGLIFFVEGRVQTALRDLRGPPEGVDIGDVLIPVGGTITGRLVESDGTEIAGGEVLIIDPWSGHCAARVTTDASGAFRAEHIGATTHHALAAVRRPGDPAGLSCYFRFDGLRAGDADVTLTVPRGIWVEVVVHDFTNDEPLAFEKGVFSLESDDGSEFVPVLRIFETPGETRASFMAQVPSPGMWVFGMELPVTGREDRRAVVIGDGPLATIVLTPR